MGGASGGCHVRRGRPRFSLLVVCVTVVLVAGCQILVEPPEPSVTWVPLPTLAPPAVEALPTPSRIATPTLAAPTPTEMPSPAVSPSPTGSPMASGAPIEPAAAAAWARDHAWSYLLAEYPAEYLPTDPDWVETGTESLVGATAYRYEAGQWISTVSVPVLPRGQSLYSVDVQGPDDFSWQAQVRWAESGPAVNAAAPVTASQVETVDGWGGKIVSLPANSPFDDYFQGIGGTVGEYGLKGLTDEVEERIVSLRDSQRLVMVWGTLDPDAEDYGDGQLVIGRLEVAGESEATLSPTEAAMTPTPTTEIAATPTPTTAAATPTPTEVVPTPTPTKAAATPTPTKAATAAPTAAASATATAAPGTAAPATAVPSSEIVEGWIGVVRPLPAGSRYDDYFDAQTPPGQYGIAGLLPRVEDELAAWRASGTPIRVWGVLDYGVDDYAGARILVSRAEVVQ
jgi:hypothetical protein